MLVLNKHYFINISPSKTKNNINGKRTNNHEIIGEPERHIMFNTQVQKIT